MLNNWPADQKNKKISKTNVKLHHKKILHSFYTININYTGLLVVRSFFRANVVKKDLFLYLSIDRRQDFNLLVLYAVYSLECT